MAETSLTIDKSTITSDVKSHLSVIGKRQSNKQGSTLFAGVTLSSIEEGIISGYIKGATSVFASAVSPTVKTYTSETSITLALSRVSAGNQNALKEAFLSFVESFVIGNILGIDYPDLSKKYMDDTQNYLQSAVKIANSKDTPTVGTTSFVIDSSITKDEKDSDGYWTDKN